jgi:DNA polymerase-3 subunit beta
MEVKNNVITFTGSNGMDTIQIAQNSMLNEDLGVVFEFDIFKVANTFTEEETTITIEGSQAKITNGKAKFTLRVLSIEDYPKFNVARGTFAPISNDLLTAITKSVKHAVSKNDNRPVLKGININDDVVTATDSFRLAQVEIDSTGFNATIPSQTLEMVNKMKLSNLEVCIDGSIITFKNDRITISSAIILGVYPDVSQLIPTEFNSNFTADTNILIDVVKKAIIMGDDKINLSFKDHKLTIASEKFTETIDVKSEGEIDLLISPSYLLDALKTINGRTNACFTTDSKPFIIVSDTPGDTNLQLILPRRKG